MISVWFGNSLSQEGSIKSSLNPDFLSLIDTVWLNGKTFDKESSVKWSLKLKLV